MEKRKTFITTKDGSRSLVILNILHSSPFIQLDGVDIHTDKKQTSTLAYDDSITVPTIIPQVKLLDYESSTEFIPIATVQSITNNTKANIYYDHKVRDLIVVPNLDFFAEGINGTLELDCYKLGFVETNADVYYNTLTMPNESGVGKITDVSPMLETITERYDLQNLTATSSSAEYSKDTSKGNLNIYKDTLKEFAVLDLSNIVGSIPVFKIYQQGMKRHGLKFYKEISSEKAKQIMIPLFF